MCCSFGASREKLVAAKVLVLRPSRFYSTVSPTLLYLPTAKGPFWGAYDHLDTIWPFTTPADNAPDR